MTRVVMNGRHYPPYAPRVLWRCLTHWLAGPLLGCSCSGPGVGLDGKPLARPSLLAADDGSCFRSPWRIGFPARDGYRERIRLADAERHITELQSAVRRLEDRLNSPLKFGESEVTVGGMTFPVGGLEVNGRDWVKTGVREDHEHDWVRQGDHYKCARCPSTLRFVGGSLPEERL